MSESAAALLPPPATADPQAHFQALRAWTNEHCMERDPVRRSSYTMALSATAHRLMKYGPDETLNTLTSRDLMCLLMFANGPLAEFIMRTAYFRAIIEGEHAVYEQFNKTLFIPECRAWYWTIAEAMMARSPDPAAVTTWLENMTGEEKAMARLIIARVFPDVAHLSWLDDVPNTSQPQMARLAAELALILLTNTNYETIVKNYLRNHPHVRYAVPEQRWGRFS